MDIKLEVIFEPTESDINQIGEWMKEGQEIDEDNLYSNWKSILKTHAGLNSGSKIVVFRLDDKPISFYTYRLDDRVLKIDIAKTRNRFM